MSLFIGNVSKHVTHRELQNLFKKYGKCKIDLRDRFAFVQFDNDNHAEAAKKQLQHQTFHGLQLNIQWSKNSGRFGENNKRKDGGGQRKRSRSRQNRWRRDDRWGRRSASNDRSSPSYSGNKDYQTFVPVCPRDLIILKKITDKVKERQNRHRERQSHRKDIQSSKNQQSTAIVNQKDEIANKVEQIKQNGHIKVENQLINNRIEQEEGAIHEDGQIPNPQ